MRFVLRGLAVAVAAGVIAIGLTISPTGAETAVGVEAGATVGDQSVDVGLVQVLQSTLDSQYVGVRVAVVRGRLILEGFATPGVHTAVLAVVARLLRTPVPVPVALGVVTPDLGLQLPLLGAAGAIELPDLGGVIRMLGVVDRIQIIR